MRNRLLGDSLLVETLDQRLASHGIPADLITIELTERSLLRPNPLVSASLAKLRAKGMAIWLDDCGTGFLLLSQLHPGCPDAVPLPAAPLRLRALWSNSAPRCSGSAAIGEDGFARFPQAPSMSHVFGTSPAAGPLGPGSDGGSDPGAPQPNPGDQPHDFSVQKEVHRQIRNDPDYDDWEYGTEPLPQEAWKLNDAAPADPA